MGPGSSCPISDWGRLLEQSLQYSTEMSERLFKECVDLGAYDLPSIAADGQFDSNNKKSRKQAWVKNSVSVVQRSGVIPEGSYRQNQAADDWRCKLSYTLIARVYSVDC